MAKDVNIKVKVDGATEAKQQLDSVAKSTQSVGQTTQQAGKDAGQGLEQAGQKATWLERILDKSQAAALRMVSGFIGIHAVIRYFQALNDQIDQMIEKQAKLTKTTLTASEGGQTLEAVTGTVGKQGYWTNQIAELQKAGGLESPKMAVALMTKAQESFKDVGGIQNPAVAAMLQRLAPKIGAAALSESDLDRIFTDEEKAMEDAWNAAEKIREKHAKHYVKPPKPDFTVSAQDFESLLSKKLGISDEQAAAYKQSPLGRFRTGAGDVAVKDVATEGFTMEWDRRTKEAQAELDRRQNRGEGRGVNPFDWAREYHESRRIAIDQLVADLKNKREQVPEDQRGVYDELIQRVGGTDETPGLPENIVLGRNRNDPMSQENTLKRALELANKPMSMNFDYSHNTIIQPKIGPDPLRERYGTQDT
jgi:hypothetical protein